MANNLESRTWTIDTFGGTVIWPSRVYIKSVYWKGPTTVGHTCAIQEADGDTIKNLICEVVAQSQFFLVEGWYAGLKVPTCQSGTLEIQIG